MKRRAPGRPAPPFRRWPGAVVATGALVSIVLVGGVAFAVVNTELGPSGMGGSEVGTPAEAAAVATLDTTEAAETADAGTSTYETRTLTIIVTDESRDRTMTVTITAPAASGSFPLVILVHGHNASAVTYASLEHEIAEAGFVVAAPDFPFEQRGRLESQRDIVAQATDVSFVISTLLDPATVPAELAGVIGTGPVGVIGHSDGGVTTAGVAFNSAAADPRIGAAVALSGGAFEFAGTWFGGDHTPALLAIHGTADEVNPFAASQSLYDEATGVKYLVAVNGGSHLGPFTTEPAVATVGALVADFLRAYLGDDATARDRIPLDASTGGLALLAAA